MLRVSAGVVRRLTQSGDTQDQVQPVAGHASYIHSVVAYTDRLSDKGAMTQQIQYARNDRSGKWGIKWRKLVSESSDEQAVKRLVRERMLGVGLNNSDFRATFDMTGWNVHPRLMSRGARDRIILSIGSFWMV